MLWEKVKALFGSAVDHVKEALGFLEPGISALAHNLEKLGVQAVESLFASAETIVVPIFEQWLLGKISGTEAKAQVLAQLKPVAIAAGLDAEHKLAGTVLNSIVELKIQEQAAKVLDAPAEVTTPSAQAAPSA